MNIAIDGPAGAGKGTIAKAVAEKLKYVYVDTGAMYRALGLYFYDRGIEATDEKTVCEGCLPVDVSIGYENGEQIVYLCGENVNGRIRTSEAGSMASVISTYGPVRRKLVQLQQELAAKESVVMDGRDIGTVVLPDAELKIYLNAAPGERARRRYLELAAKGEDVTLEKVEAEIIERDNRDMNRAESPLRKAADAIEIDSTDMTIEEVVNQVIELVDRIK